MKALSEQLIDLADRSKKIEDVVAAARERNRVLFDEARLLLSNRATTSSLFRCRRGGRHIHWRCGAPATGADVALARDVLDRQLVDLDGIQVVPASDFHRACARR
jgi:hypothetical protein